MPKSKKKKNALVSVASRANSAADFLRSNKDNFVAALKSTITVLLFFVAFIMVLYALIVLVRFVLG